MAEKEERITIHQVLYPCKKCSINCNKNDWKDCDFYQNYISGMTRQEAIDKMCEGWNKLREQINADKEHAHCCSNKMIMESALNALLEEGK